LNPELIFDFRLVIADLKIENPKSQIDNPREAQDGF